MMKEFLAIVSLTAAGVFFSIAIKNYLRFRRLIQINRELDEIGKAVHNDMIETIASLSPHQLVVFHALSSANKTINSAVINGVGRERYKEALMKADDCDYVSGCAHFVAAIDKVIQAEKLKRELAEQKEGAKP